VRCEQQFDGVDAVRTERHRPRLELVGADPVHHGHHDPVRVETGGDGELDPRVRHRELAELGAGELREHSGAADPPVVQGGAELGDPRP